MENPLRINGRERGFDVEPRTLLVPLLRDEAALAAQGVEPLDDLYASAGFRRRPASVRTERALREASWWAGGRDTPAPSFPEPGILENVP